MIQFTYSPDQRAAIISSLPGSVYFGSQAASDDDVIAVLTARAREYIERKRMLTADSVRRKLEALELVKSLLNSSDDGDHRKRVGREIDRWNSELSLIDTSERDHRARLRFMVDAFQVFANAEGTFSPFVDNIALSVSNSPAFHFFKAAIAPVCLAAGEGLKTRAAINALNVFKHELFEAETGCAVNRLKISRSRHR